ncbi:MAG: NAD(+)/NADH kinase [Armatimonadetes bacterium]|nr:NAD(+)/NADH kinase [Armatimonadota bacterium]
MRSVKIERLLIVSKRTKLEDLADQYGRPDLEQLIPLLDSQKADVSALTQEHEIHQSALARVSQAVESLGLSVLTISVTRLRGGDFQDVDLVLSLGGDGTFVTAAHFIPATIPLLGINSNPGGSGQRIYSLGAYTRVRADDFPSKLKALIDGQEGRDYFLETRTRMEVRINSDPSNTCLAFAEVFIGHPLRKKNSKHILDVDGVAEEQPRTSGIIVYPAHSYGAWAKDEGAPSPPDPLGIYYRVTGILAQKYGLRGGQIRDQLTCTSSLTDGVVSVDTFFDYPFIFGQMVMVRKAEEKLAVVSFQCPE